MLSSIFNKIKNKLLPNKYRKRSRRAYDIVFDTDIMTVDTSDNGTSPPPPSPVITRRLFNIDVDETIIKNDYDLQKLVNTMEIYQFNLENVVLERRIEQLIHDIPGASEIMKIKMKMIYIMIAHDIYRHVFEEKKLYSSTLTKQYIGVFHYNDYIIRIDDSPYSFINEAAVVDATSKYDDHSNIIRPFLIYTNIRRNSKNNICECATNVKCDCKYIDGADAEIRDTDTDGYDIRSKSFHKLRENTISFSIQHYVKTTVGLYNWAKDIMGNYVYNQFSSIQLPFFIHLFYQCALLLREIHKVSVVHGDIKPDNILIREHDDFNINHPDKCKNFTVYLIDFGLSGIHNVGIGTGGTMPYCHPEFKNTSDTISSKKYNWKTMNKKHDVWSLGISFLTMYIYRDFYNYYNKYPKYFFTKDGYISPLIFDVIAHDKLNRLFTNLLSFECISSDELCETLHNMTID
jgi:serine/threonine protein kinase